MLPHWRHVPELVPCQAWSCVGSGDGSPTMSHVIPPRLPQILTLHRWNCNVLSSARKMTEGNYVRLYSARSGDPAVAAFCSRRGRALVPLQPCRRPPHWWCVVGCLVRSASPATNFAYNSPVTISNHEFTALELQCFRALLNLHPIELHATFGGEEQAALPAAPSTQLE